MPGTIWVRGKCYRLTPGGVKYILLGGSIKKKIVFDFLKPPLLKNTGFFDFSQFSRFFSFFLWFLIVFFKN